MGYRWESSYNNPWAVAAYNFLQQLGAVILETLYLTYTPYKGMTAYDDATGDELDPTAAAAAEARQEDVGYDKAMHVYKKVPLEECDSRTGKGPIQCRWIDIHTGDRTTLKYRSRLVAKQFAYSNA